MTTNQQHIEANQPEYLEKEFHLMLLAGRLLVQYSAATERVHQAIDQLALKFGLEARLFVDYKAITLTTKNENDYVSRFSRSIPSLSINMAIITQIFRLLEQIKQDQKTLEQAIEQLEKISQISFYYPRFLIVLMLGISAGSLARIFQGDWQSCLITGVATAIGMILRQELGARKFNFFLITFLVAFIGGLMSGIAIKLNWTTTAEMCLLVPAMMLVPGVHLINGILDLVENHILVGIARLGLSIVTLSAITFGLLLATAMTDNLVPVSSSIPPLSLPEDMFFAGLVAAGFAISFNVPRKMLWACILCGMVGHGARWISIESSLGIIWGNLIASTTVGLMTIYLAKRFRAPSAAIAFGAVVGMIPGIYFFQACSGLIQIVSVGAQVSFVLVANTLATGAKAVLMTLALSLGLALPTLLFFYNEGGDSEQLTVNSEQ